MSHVPVRLNETLATGLVWPRSVTASRSFPRATSQVLASPSTPPVATRRPSRLNSTSSTVAP